MIKSKQSITSAITFLLLIAIITTLTACSLFTVKVKADDLMEGVNANTVSGKALNDTFINNTANFSVELFKKAIKTDENSLISPTSVILALSMTANGADNETLAQIEKVFGGISIDDMNEYLYTYVKNLPSNEKTKLKIANSIWFRDEENRLTVEKDFLQKNADYYDAATYKSAFDKQTVKDINNWVNENTDGTIDKIIETINDDDIMYLINAIVFDGEWEKVYEKKDINNGEFTAIDKSKHNIDFMHSDENKYIKDSNTTGFIKPYADNKYSFVALLPNEDVDINNYISSLTGEKFINLIKTVQNTTVSAYLPKFSYEYEIEMKDALIDLGIKDAFDADKADFKKLTKSANGNVYVGKVFHKTYIEVYEHGTKAGAITFFGVKNGCAMIDTEVKLNRPFVYAIIDNSTNLPLFIGTVMNITE